jgi:hypothetical protein
MQERYHDCLVIGGGELAGAGTDARTADGAIALFEPRWPRMNLGTMAIV